MLHNFTCYKIKWSKANIVVTLCSNKPCNDLMSVHSTRRTKEPSETKITDFQYTFAVDQQIIWLQILQQHENTTH